MVTAKHTMFNKFCSWNHPYKKMKGAIQMTIDKQDYFKTTYEQSREVFRGHLDAIKKKWPNAVISTKPIGHEADNTIDMIYAEALNENKQVLFFTIGEHGIEGFAGAACTHVFINEYLDRIDPHTTGICLIHALNPWGMRNYRRVTENNVDLNRNYLYDPDSVPKDINDHYSKESDMFLPNGKIADLTQEKRKLYTQLSKALVTTGYSGIKKAKGMGQFEFERGVYYGGKQEEPNTAYLKEIQKKLLSTFARVVHMDWHTALGPANEITMVISDLDGRSEAQLKETYQLKNILPFSADKVKGDSTHHFHKVRKEEYPDTKLFSALFEFGTFGTGKKAEFREFQTIILENHLYFEGAKKQEDIDWIMNEFKEMFYPDDPEWRDSVIKEARLGIEAVLTAEGILH